MSSIVAGTTFEIAGSFVTIFRLANFIFSISVMSVFSGGRLWQRVFEQAVEAGVTSFRSRCWNSTTQERTAVEQLLGWGLLDRYLSPRCSFVSLDQPYRFSIHLFRPC